MNDRGCSIYGVDGISRPVQPNHRSQPTSHDVNPNHILSSHQFNCHLHTSKIVYAFDFAGFNTSQAVNDVLDAGFGRQNRNPSMDSRPGTQQCPRPIDGYRSDCYHLSSVSIDWYPAALEHLSDISSGIFGAGPGWGIVDFDIVDQAANRMHQEENLPVPRAPVWKQFARCAWVHPNNIAGWDITPDPNTINQPRDDKRPIIEWWQNAYTDLTSPLDLNDILFDTTFALVGKAVDQPHFRFFTQLVITYVPCSCVIETAELMRMCSTDVPEITAVPLTPRGTQP